MIRQVKINDFKSIKKLQKSLTLDANRITEKVYRWKVQKSGFLIGDYTRENFLKDITRRQ